MDKVKNKGSVVLPAGKVKYIHVSQPNIRKNIRSEEKLPVIVVKAGGKNYYTNEVEVTSGRFMYNPEKPILSCGARVVFRTTDTVRFKNEG